MRDAGLRWLPVMAPVVAATADGQAAHARVQGRCRGVHAMDRRRPGLGVTVDSEADFWGSDVRLCDRRCRERRLRAARPADGGTLDRTASASLCAVTERA